VKKQEQGQDIHAKGSPQFKINWLEYSVTGAPSNPRPGCRLRVTQLPFTQSRSPYRRYVVTYAADLSA